MKGKLLFLGVFLVTLCGFFLYWLNDNENNNYKAKYNSSDDLKNKVIENKEANNKDENIEEDKKIKQQILDKKLKQETSINVDSNDVEMKDNFVDHNVNNDNNIQNSNYDYIEKPNNDIINDNIQNNVSDNNSSQDDNNSDNQDYNAPTNIEDVGINDNTNTDLYSTYEECNQAGIDLMLKVMSDDIINTFCFSYAENGRLVGYRLDINCKSGNCDKYK